MGGGEGAGIRTVNKGLLLDSALCVCVCVCARVQCAHVQYIQRCSGT